MTEGLYSSHLACKLCAGLLSHGPSKLCLLSGAALLQIHLSEEVSKVTQTGGLPEVLMQMQAGCTPEVNVSTEPFKSAPCGICGRQLNSKHSVEQANRNLLRHLQRVHKESKDITKSSASSVLSTTTATLSPLSPVSSGFSSSPNSPSFRQPVVYQRCDECKRKHRKCTHFPASQATSSPTSLHPPAPPQTKPQLQPPLKLQRTDRSRRLPPLQQQSGFLSDPCPDCGKVLTSSESQPEAQRNLLRHRSRVHNVQPNVLFTTPGAEAAIDTS
eukprot:g4246.t1